MHACVIIVAMLALSCSADAYRPGAIALTLPVRVRGAGGSLAPAQQRRALLSRAQTLLSWQTLWPTPRARLSAGIHGLSAALVGRRAPAQSTPERSRTSASALLSVTAPVQSRHLAGGAGGGPTDDDRRGTAREVLLVMAGGALPDPALVRELKLVAFGATWGD
jgi:hypothetical protein